MSDIYDNLEIIIEAALFSAGEPLSADRLQKMFAWAGRPSLNDIRSVIDKLKQTYGSRGVELVEVSTGYRFQCRPEFAEYLQKLDEKKSPKYSRATLETLALIVYRQPITRGEIEDVRGVPVASNIIRTLQEREWIKEVGVKDVPGKPALFGTTKQFLDDFNLKSLSELPPLDDLMDLDALEQKLGVQFDLPVEPPVDAAIPEEVQSEGEAKEDSASQATEEMESESITG